MYASVRFEHSACRGSLMTTYIYIYIYIIYINIYIYIYINVYICIYILIHMYIFNIGFTQLGIANYHYILANSKKCYSVIMVNADMVGSKGYKESCNFAMSKFIY